MTHQIEAGMALAVGVGFLVQGLFSVARTLWARAVARKHVRPWWRFATALPFVGLGFTVVGLGITTAMLIAVFRTVGQTDASQKARVLSEGINGAMLATAICLPASWLAYGASLVSSVIGSLRPPTPH